MMNSSLIAEEAQTQPCSLSIRMPQGTGKKQVCPKIANASSILCEGDGIHSCKGMHVALQPDWDFPN